MHNELVAGSFSATLLRNLAVKLLYIRTQYSIIAPLGNTSLEHEVQKVSHNVYEHLERMQKK
jgi:hypothetical protein